MSDTTSIKFEGLRGVGNVELDLRADQRVYAFIGTNGVGKTKILEGMFQANFLYIDAVRRFAQKNNHGATKETFVFRKAVLPNGCVVQIPDPEHSFIHVINSCQGDSNSLPLLFLGANARGIISPPDSYVALIGKFEDRGAAHILAAFSAMTHQKMSILGMDEKISAWFVTRAQSANPFQKTADNRKVEIDVLLKALNRIDARISSDFMEIDGANNVSIKIGSAIVELKHLSSGFASLVKMLQAIISGYANFTNETNLTHVKGIVLIDEIESHLHIEWQAKIIPLLKSLFPNTTFYVATHSALVLTQLQQGEAYLLKRDATDGVVRSEMIKNPGGKLFDDVLSEAFGISLNALKRKRMDENAQTEGKKLLLELLDEVSQD